MTLCDLDITAGFQVATYPIGATFGPRVLRDWEFVWMIEGDAVYTADGDSVSVPQSSILLCQNGSTDAFVWDTKKRTRHGWFHFQFAGDPPPEWGAPQTWARVRPASPLLEQLFRALIASGIVIGEVPVATRLLALSLLAVFVTGITEANGVEHAAYPDPVARAMAFIASRLEESPARAVSLGAIARAAFVSPEHLCRLFAAHTGHSPSETVRLLRLDRAAVLLVRTNFAVGEIATLCGFASPFHFSRRFKEAFGQTPSELRQSVAGGHGTVPLTRLVRVQ